MPLAAPPGPLWTADAKEPHPLQILDRSKGERAVRHVASISQQREIACGILVDDEDRQQVGLALQRDIRIKGIRTRKSVLDDVQVRDDMTVVHEEPRAATCGSALLPVRRCSAVGNGDTHG